MNVLKKGLFTALLLGGLAAAGAIKSETVEYTVDGHVHRGYLAYPADATGKLPGVLVVHEWMGLEDYAKSRANALADLGYVAFAADMYGGGKVAKDVAEASSLSGALKNGDRAEMRKRAAAALDVLKKNAHVDPSRVAAMGYCFGGMVVLELARSGADLRAVVSFHGALDTPEPKDAARIKAAVLACHGADDPYVPKAAVDAFQDEMRKAGVDWQLIQYGDAVHGFTNPRNGTDKSKGAAYNATADRRSWALMRAFFEERLGK